MSKGSFSDENIHNILYETISGWHIPNNVVYELPWFEISYNPCTPSTIFTAWWEEETCLFVSGEFAILDGDHVEDYKKCKNMEEALEYFNLNKHMYLSEFNTYDS